MVRRILLTLIFSFSLLNFSPAQAWYPLQSGITSDFGVLATATYNGQLYAGGWFYQAGGLLVNNMARWNGFNWDSVGSGLTGGQNYVAALCVYNGKLYACGSFYSAEGLPANNIAVWDGSHWDTVSTKGLGYCGGGTGWADAMAVYNGKLYVAGAFCSAGGITAENIACWDGSKWDSVSSGINDSVNALTVYNGKLYAGGIFTRAGYRTVSNIASWNGIAWDTVGLGTNGAVFALQAYKSDLYAGGGFSMAGSITAKYIARWNDVSWSAVGAGFTGSTGVEAFGVFNSLLYTGGAFTKCGTLATNNIAVWNGSVWDTVGTKGINNTVDAFAVLDSTLYAGGIFTRAGNVNALNIAAWGGVSLGVNEVNCEGEEVRVYPNPNNGIFTISLSHAEPVSASQPIIEIYNILGEKVNIGLLEQIQYDYVLDIGNQPAGIYLYRIVNQLGGVVGQGKIIIE
jgi:hypothetical protein